MWSQLAWFDEEFQANDPEVRDWIERGRNFTLADQRRMGEKQREIVGQVLPAYAKLAATGQIEISTTPYYHPILPLLCDSNIAGVSHPNVPLPPRFRYPGDARRQLELAREYVEQHFGVAPVGLWPSEGSVSDEVFTFASELGFEWAATDSGVLDRTQRRAVSVDGLYRPYEWRQGGNRMRLIFRDHFMSDLIGFVYSKMDASPRGRRFSAPHPRELRGNSGVRPRRPGARSFWTARMPGNTTTATAVPSCANSTGASPMTRGMRAVTVSEAFRLMAPEPLDHIFPGSWINANFDVWIGAEEDNQAWTQLLRARATYDATTGVPETIAAWRSRNC